MIRQLRILVSAAGILDDRFGGGQVYVQGVAVALRERGHRVTLLAPAGWPAGNCEAVWIGSGLFRDIPIFRVAVNPSCVGREEKVRQTPPVLSGALEEIIGQVKPEIVHINGWKPALVPLCRELGLPHVVTAHHAGIICPAGALLRPDDTLCWEIARPAVCVRCCCQHRMRGSVAGWLLGSIPQRIYRCVGRFLAARRRVPFVGRAMMYPWLTECALEGRMSALVRSQRFIAPSKATARLLTLNGVPPSRIRVVPHGIRPLARQPLVGLGKRPLRFGYIGRISRIKGLHVLFDAFCRLTSGSTTLHIFGAPQSAAEQVYLEACWRLAKPGAAIMVHGLFEQSDLPNVLGQIDVLVLPSICHEVFGLCVAEAFSAGRPVIASRCGGPEDLVSHGVDGLVVARNSVEALAGAMRQLVQNPEKVLAMADQIKPVPTVKEHVRTLEAIFQEVQEESQTLVVKTAG